MADLFTLVERMKRDGSFAQIMNSPAAQFGTDNEPMLGATLLPERTVPENAFREASIRYRTVIANSGTRYGPAQLKSGDLIGDFMVELGNSDIAFQLTGSDYDKLIDLLSDDATAQAFLSRFLDTKINRALLTLNEKQRWDAIVNASVVRLGDNGYTETVTYPNDPAYRVTVAAAWSDDANDPFDDILAMADKLESVERIICGRSVLSILAQNAKVRTRTGSAVLTAAGGVTALNGRASLDAINGALAAENLPPIEVYNGKYRTQTGSGYYLDRAAMVMVGNTDQREEPVSETAESIAIENTIGYTAVGRAAGQRTPGRVTYVEAFQNKPPRVEMEGWQTSLPVITDVQAFGVLKGIA